MAAIDRNNPKRAASSESRMSLMEFMREFPDDATCLEYLWRTRFSEDGEHATCPKCEQVRAFRKYAMSNRKTSWTCTGCGHHVHPLAGTIYEKSSTSLHLWFYALYLMSSTRCGISAKQLERELGVTYKTAWRMFHLIRNQLMTQDDEPLSGEVEMDEMYVGGKPRNKDRREFAKAGLSQAERFQAAQVWSDRRKSKVFGMVERGGKVKAYVVPAVDGATLMPHITTRVMPASTVYTDEAKVYRGVAKAGYEHRRIQHTERVYVSGAVHTQTIEGFWSLVKRGIGGTHHAVSAKHLQGYLNEYVFRYNHRKGADPFRVLLARSAFPTA
jgi:transposase-like protein